MSKQVKRSQMPSNATSAMLARLKAMGDPSAKQLTLRVPNVVHQALATVAKQSGETVGEVASHILTGFFDTAQREFEAAQEGSGSEG